MNGEQLVKMLSAQISPLETANLMRESYIPYLIESFNQPNVQKRLGLYQGERIPDNERNLTDVRNRVSLIVEYELARLSNQILEKYGIDDLFWSYVVANRFPDLEIRRRDGNRCLRIEVKCLQSIAEEKSANFDTLKKDINPISDFVVVFVWEWSYGGTVFLWDRAPKLLKCYIFHAYSLAELRDHYWLNKPPSDLGTGYQGFDLRFAVNCKNDVYAQEEGNYGKLFRIWKKDFEFRPKETPVLLDTEKEYLRFQEEVIIEGFLSLCDYHLPRLAKSSILNKMKNNGKLIGIKAGDFGFFLNSLVDAKDILLHMKNNNINFGVVMNDKYGSAGYEVKDGKLVKLFKRLKPKLLDRAHFHLV